MPPLPTSSPGLSAFWRNQLRQWHWISSALCLISLIAFAITGFTLNHASQIEAKPVTVHTEKDLPVAVLPALQAAKDKLAAPAVVAAAVKSTIGVDIARIPAQVSDGELYVDMTTPGIDASVTIDTQSGHVTYERSDRGLIAVLNDLHKGRHAGPVWGLFIDLIALACMIFSVTGLGLLWLYGKNRRITWPLVGLGVLIPFILFMIFVHA